MIGCNTIKPIQSETIFVDCGISIGRAKLQEVHPVQELNAIISWGTLKETYNFRRIHRKSLNIQRDFIALLVSVRFLIGEDNALLLHTLCLLLLLTYLDFLHIRKDSRHQQLRELGNCTVPTNNRPYLDC